MRLPRSVWEAGSDHARAYAQAVTSLRSPLGIPPFQPNVDAAEQVLARSIAQAFLTSTNPFQTAASLASAYTAFWTAPPITFPAPFLGVVTAVLGTASLQTALLAAWSTNVSIRITQDEAMRQLAQILLVFSHTVIITHATTPTPTVGPLV